jgi:hypothetical protein
MQETLIKCYSEMRQSHRCSVDEILVTPELRESFLQIVNDVHPEAGERTILQTLTNLRKRRLLPTSDSLT